MILHIMLSLTVDEEAHREGEAGAHDEKGITESWKSHVDSRPNGPSSVGIDISFQVKSKLGSRGVI